MDFFGVKLKNPGVSQIENVKLETLSSHPNSDNFVGRIYFNSGDKLFYYCTNPVGPVFTPFATGGDATALQNEVDAIEASLGAGIGTNGSFQTAGFTGATYISSPTSFTNAIMQLDSAINSNNTLAELDDVTLGTLANKDVLYYDSSANKWKNAPVGATSGVQGYDAGLDSLAALVASAGDMIYATAADTYTTTASTSFGRGVLNLADAAALRSYAGSVIGTDVQAWDTGLDALAAKSSTGIMVQTGANSYSSVTLTAPSEGFTITNADGVAGNPTFVLANDLAALEGLTTTGYVIRTGDGTAVTRSIAGTSGRIVVSNGDGVETDTNVDLATVSQGSGGSFLKFMVDSYGRVSANTAVTTADITGLVDSTYVNVTGDSMSGNLTMTGGATVTGVPNPVNGSDAVNKAYTDALVTGLTWKNAVRVLSDANVNLATAGLLTIHGVTLVDGDRVLVTSQTNATENGIYVAHPGSWVRALDMDTSAEIPRAATLVSEEDTSYGHTAWVCTNADGVVVGTDNITFVQFNGAAGITAGTGLSLVGNTLNVNLGAGIVELDSDNVGIDLYNSTTGAIILTTDGSARSTSNTTKLHLLLKSAGGLTQDVNGLYIPSAGVINAMLANSTLTLNADSGTSNPIALGETLLIQGVSVQGISTSISDNTFTVTAADASSSQKGVASFNATNFTVTSGNVIIAAGGVSGTELNTSVAGTGLSGGGGSALSVNVDNSTLEIPDDTLQVKDGGITNIKLANSSVTFAGNSGTPDPVALGETVTISGSGGVSTAITANTVSISLASNLSILASETATSGNVLVGNGTNFVSTKVRHEQSFSAVTSVSVNHNLGVKYCVVQVFDNNDYVVIPYSIKMNDANNCTVSFGSNSVTGTVVVIAR